MKNRTDQMTIGKKLWFLCLGLIFTMVTVGVMSFWSSKVITHALKEAEGTDIPMVRNMALVDMMHDGIRGNVLNAILVSGSKDPKELDDIRKESVDFSNNMRAYISELQKLETEPTIAKLIEVALPEIATYEKTAHEIVETALSGNKDEALKLLPGFQEGFEKLETDLGALGDSIAKSIEEAAKEDQEKIDRSEMTSIAVVIFGFVIGLFFSWIIISKLQATLQDVVKNLAEESRSVSAAAHSLSDASENLSNSTTQQASAIQETAASISEITAMVKKTSDNSKNLEVSAQESQHAATKGQQSITEMLAAIDNISDSHAKIMHQVEEGNQKITEIVKVIGEIGNKTKVINDIVFQTKLLSFNASVEAARAGEHGKGFAVVAEEVGNLAQMSGNAAKEISDMLSASISKVEGIVSENKRSVEVLIVDGKGKIEHGAKVAKQCGLSLDEIVNNSMGVGSMIGEITTAIQEQNQGIHEISKAIQLLDQSTHENSATSKETSTTSRDLLGQSQSLSSIVSLLEQMFTGATTSETKSMVHPNTPHGTPGPTLSNSRPMAKAKIISIEKRKVPTSSQETNVVRHEMKRAAGSGVVIPSENDPRFEDV